MLLACVRMHRVLVLNSYPDPPISEILYPHLIVLFLVMLIRIHVISLQTRGGNRAYPVCIAHQVYYQIPDSVGPVCDQLLTRAQGHSAVVLPLITSFIGHSGAVVHGATTGEL